MGFIQNRKEKAENRKQTKKPLENVKYLTPQNYWHFKISTIRLVVNLNRGYADLRGAGFFMYHFCICQVVTSCVFFSETNGNIVEKKNKRKYNCDLQVLPFDGVKA